MMMNAPKAVAAAHIAIHAARSNGFFASNARTNLSHFSIPARFSRM
jgi:hypothetical protein